MEGERNWEGLNNDCLVKMFERVGLESLIFDIPFVCKSWYLSSLNPECWKRLRFSGGFWDLENPCSFLFNGFRQRFIDEYQVKHFSITGFVKLLISKSRRSAVSVWLPNESNTEILDFISKECPALKALGIPHILLRENCKEIQELVGKFKHLQRLHLGSNHFSFKEILTQVSINCMNFNGLSVRGVVGNAEASAIATLLPKIKYLWLRKKTLVQRESLQMILEGCKELVLLDARDCIGFQAEDDEILKMASHIKTFKVEGSCLDDHPEYHNAFTYIYFCLDDDTDDEWFCV